jgi:tRNA dimethylallyltransferase
MPTIAAQAPDCLCLVGPTGTGKSRAAAELAERFQGEIVNCDSRQVYRDFPLITAQPDQDLTRRCPHWLYGFLRTDQGCSAGFFAEQALTRIEEIRSRGKWPILVGGTGLYLRSILKGLAPIPPIPSTIRAEVLQQCREEGKERLHALLAEIDPESAAAIHPRDAQRVTRAVEVYRATGKPLSWWKDRDRSAPPRFRALKLGMYEDLAELTPKLVERIDRMLEKGAMEEVRRAWQACPDEQAPGWSGIGCCELLAHLHGRWTLEQAKAEWLRKTRAYAKRQLTWFTKEEGLIWFGPGQSASMLECVASRCEAPTMPSKADGD